MSTNVLQYKSLGLRTLTVVASEETYLNKSCLHIFNDNFRLMGAWPLVLLKATIGLVNTFSTISTIKLL